MRTRLHNSSAESRVLFTVSTKLLKVPSSTTKEPPLLRSTIACDEDEMPSGVGGIEELPPCKSLDEEAEDLVLSLLVVQTIFIQYIT